MKTKYFLVIIIALLTSSCLKKKKTGNCEFNKLEFVKLKSQNIGIEDNMTIFECLQLEIDEDIMRITNSEKTINITYSMSSENIIEEIDINLNDEIKESFDSVDEQEIELNEKEKFWNIIFKSDNKSKFNGYLKLYKTSDGDYRKTEEEPEDESIK